MNTNTTTSLTATDPNNDGDLWIECACGGCGYQSRGALTHRRNCRTKAQYSAPPVTATATAELTVNTNDELRIFARNVRAYSQTKGRDTDTVNAVRGGYLSVDDAMNTDD